MAQIGTFTLKDGTWTGTIRTLTINVKAQLVPNREQKAGAPDYRLYAGGAELGAAWRQERKDGEKPHIAIRFDDPSFAAPMRAAFFANEPEGTAVMVWSRQKASAEH
jgi:uncharacterized protein (DUF736 family)